MAEVNNNWVFALVFLWAVVALLATVDNLSFQKKILSELQVHNESQVTCPDTPQIQQDTKVYEYELPEKKSLTEAQIMHHKRLIIEKIINTECYKNRLKSPPDDQFFGFAKDTTVNHWEGTEFMVRTEVELKRMGKGLALETHTLRYDVDLKQIVACDAPITFAYEDFKLLG